MSVNLCLHKQQSWPEPLAVLTLVKPITWFPPMWAFLCGVVSSGAALGPQVGLVFMGILLAGPITCGMSQAANDWCDRHVDAINEPHRPIPSGRIPGRWGLWIALVMTVIAVMIGYTLGPWGFGATLVAIFAAWAYSAEPVRLKRSGWWGPGLCGLAYETLPWFTGAAVMSSNAPRVEIVIIALLYGLGAHGIMTLNDFKALEGDRATGLRSLPVVMGPQDAATVACVGMTICQLVVIILLALWGMLFYAAIIALGLMAQLYCMAILYRDPKKLAPWYNGTGVMLYVLGMMVAAIALRGLA